MGIRFPWRASGDPWVLPLWVAGGVDGNIIATRRFQVVWQATVLWLQRGRGGRAGIRRWPAVPPDRLGRNWAQHCGGGEMILASAWLLKP